MEEEETCRICRSGPEEDMPLYHPCKCSGSIAKVHQDCLIDWLQHSKKKSCELCNTQLRFHKVYSPTMPAKLPAYLYLRRLFVQSLLGLRFLLRGIIVCFSWCALLPLLNLGVWRLHFMVVDHVIWGLIGGAPPSSRLSASLLSNSTLNATQPSNSLIATTPSSAILADVPTSNVNASSTAPSLDIRQHISVKMSLSFFNISTNATYNTLDHLAQDTFEGQMLTCAIVLFFVAIFLLREWCLQNLPQPVDGIAFAAPAAPAAILPAPEPAAPEAEAPPAVETHPIRPDSAIPTGLDWQVPETEQAGGGLAPPVQALGPERAFLPRDEATDHSPPLRPRLRHGGIPDPPEMQVLASGRTQENGSIVGMKPLSRAEVARYLPMEEMRRKRTERFGASSQGVGGPSIVEGKEGDEAIQQQSYENSDLMDKGKAKEGLTNAAESTQSDQGKGKSKAIDEETWGEEEEEDIWEDSTALLEPSIDGTPQIGSFSKETVLASGAGDTNISDLGTTARVIEEGEETELDERREDNEEEDEEQAEERRDDEMAGLPVDVHGWDDDIDNGERLEDDMDGMLEAIGLQGPLINLFTNMLMMFVLCSFVLVIAVALPYLIARVVGVGSNFIKFANLPLRGLRFFTDPLVDYIVLQSAKGVDRVMRLAIVKKFAGGKLMRLSASAMQMAGRSSWYQHAITRLSSNAAGTTVSAEGASITSEQMIAIASEQTPRAKEALEASVVAMCDNLQSRYMQLSASLHALYLKVEAKTQGVSQDDKMFCVLLGHLYWLMGLFIQKRLSSLYLRWNLKWLKTSVDQQLVVFKVLAFIILELAIFPWCCGVLLDITLFPLWQDVTLYSRLALIKSNPLSVGFTQWALGTLYMFALAQFVSNTRSIVRPGVLCFVRDAGDPGFHPIKDILERKSVEQLRKIGVSGLIYSSILIATIGVCSNVIWLADRHANVFPLRWEMHQSLTTTGLEYVFIAIALPPIIKAWLPSNQLKKGVKGWWKLVARQLRISSYLIGGPFADERGRHVGRTWRAAFKRHNQEATTGMTFVADGGFGRVPADDQAIMSSPIVIRTNESGEPISERGQEAMQKQQEAIDKMTKKPQYTVVYLPPHFRARIIALLVALWASISASFVVILLVPLLTGRIFIDTILEPASHPPLHDGYSWLFGAMSIGTAVQFVKAARRLSRSNRPSRRLGKMTRRVAEYVWVFFFVSLTGCLLGISVELYINGLFRPFVPTKSAALPDISVWHSWSMGMLLQFIVVQVFEMVRGPAAPINWDQAPLTGASAVHAIIELRASNLRKPKMWTLTKKGFLPSIIIFVYAIVAPLLLIFGIQLAFGKASTKEGQCLQVYLAFMICLMSLWFGLLVKAVGRIAERWTALIRDEVFLISTQLKNYSSDDQKMANGTTTDTHAADGPLPDALLNR